MTATGDAVWLKTMLMFMIISSYLIAVALIHFIFTAVLFFGIILVVWSVACCGSKMRVDIVVP